MLRLEYQDFLSRAKATHFFGCTTTDACFGIHFDEFRTSNDRS